ncbi:hypothetical protein [Rufibacter immobilis]|uniref:hypothetical protein n=1 Tax=Rufibacter immobilis TaxID=1348778 RepID=UPI0035E7828B
MDEQLLAAVQEAAQKKKFTRIQYVTNLQEYLTVTALIKQLQEREDGIYLELATGEEIKFDQLVKVGDTPSNKYNSRDFTCDC